MSTSALADRFETADGSRPDARALDEQAARRLPLVAFTVLAGGDAFEGGSAPKDGLACASAWVKERVHLERHRAPKELAARVTERMARQLAGNPTLVARLAGAPPITVDLVPEGGSFVALGFPAAVLERAAGLFWGDQSWPAARIALRREHVDATPMLVEHELSHAVFALAFTTKEQEVAYGHLRPVFGARAAMDEAFAIYSERELCGSWDELERHAPGVYGFTRRQWREDHVFTRFVRKLWFPFKPLAGARPAVEGHRRWNKFSGAR
ncbi:MAG: hypothetical protein A2138_06900 [Deltaproteobacteria bacterium RBG_16_71_12]|nr:MAG: hypothetical protein A2138_06900 [Deltaproteobacteria bacterium RBG_16_71_12]